jgi:preprotein translocase subunit YajC
MMLASALVQASPGTGTGAGGGMTILLLQFVAIGAVFYFLILRPQNKAKRVHQQLLAALKKGDEVMTAGGIIGRVKDMKEVEFGTSKETRVTVESGTSTVIVERGRIIRVGSAAAPGAGAG